jgi:hypothetical protein
MNTSLVIPERVDYTGKYYWLPYFTVITVLVLASSDQRSDYATIVAHLLYFYPLRVVVRYERLYHPYPISHTLPLTSFYCFCPICVWFFLECQKSLFISHMLCPVTDNVVGKRPPSIPRTSRKSVALLPIHRVERPTNRCLAQA